MTTQSIDSSWITFANSINGKTIFIPIANPGTSNLFDNIFRIITKEDKIELIWADQPVQGYGSFVNLKSNFYFTLKRNEKLSFRFYKGSILLNLFTFFKPSRIRTGDKEIDKNYILISTKLAILKKIIPHLRTMAKQEKYKDFSMAIEEIEDSKYLVIQVNNLVIGEDSLNLFYENGRLISEQLNTGL